MGPELIQSQVQTVSPQTALTMRLLQFNARELRSFLEDEALENPMLDLDEPKLSEDELFLAEYGSFSARVPYRYSSRSSQGEEYGEWQYGAGVSTENTLSFHLKSQLYAARIEPRLYSAAEWIIDNLDSNGFYEPIPGVEPFSPELREQALKLLRSFNPVGIAARDLRQCLLLQLSQLPGEHETAKLIVSDYLDDLAKSHYNRIASELGISQAIVRAACDEIRGLNPRPGAGFDSPEPNQYIRPDIAVTVAGGIPTVVVLERDIPGISFNPYYSDLLRTSEDGEVLEYLREKQFRVRLLRQSVKHRHSTLQRCTQAIIKRQARFFVENGDIMPLTMREIAEDIGMHESTVSRAVAGKYIQCSRGIYQMDSFFARSVGESDAGLTPERVKVAITELINGENKQSPLSDSRLCSLLAERKIEISRRTIAKYRAELGILPATGRKDRHSAK